MVVADTNVWARALLNDDASQSQKARKTIAAARSKSGIFVPLIVVVELAWVLRPRLGREGALASIEDLMLGDGVIVESPALVDEAITATRSGNGGFADQLIAQVGLANGATEVITFDEKFARSANVRQLK
jgi:predicted nucleic-acid-binding protein